MHATTVAVDSAKDVFELALADRDHRLIARKRRSRAAFARCLENAPPCTVLMEACGSAHYWGRRFAAHGHTPRLLPPRDVRPYVRRNKTDHTDAAGLLEADRCAEVHPVPIKSAQQQGIQALHRIREQLQAQRTATLNLLRGVLREFGVTVPVGAAKVPAAMRAALEDGDNELPMALRATLAGLLEHAHALAVQMAAIQARGWPSLPIVMSPASAISKSRESASSPRPHCPPAWAICSVFAAAGTSPPGWACHPASTPRAGGAARAA